MKNVVILFLITSISIYSQAADFTNSGLFIETAISWYATPTSDFDFDLNLFYRFTGGAVPDLYRNNRVKTDVGIKNESMMSLNKTSIYVNSTIASFFNIKARASGIAYYNSAGRGLIIFDSNEEYNAQSIDEMIKGKGANGSSFEFEVKPTLRLDLRELVFKTTGLYIESGVAIKYAFLKNADFYYDYDLLLPRAKSDISYELDSRAVFDMKPIAVGVQHILVYMQNTDILAQRLGAYLKFEYAFVNQRLYTKVESHVGQYFSYFNLTGRLYFDITASLAYKII